MNARAAAARALAGVIHSGRTLDEALPNLAEQLPDPRDRALTKELCYGVLRNYFSLDASVESMLQRPLRPGDTDIKALLLAGLYQLDYLDVPDHAAVSETVEAARQLQKPWAAALVNALLRRYRRDRNTSSGDSSRSAKHGHPEWLIDAVRADWPEYWESILEANNQRPPLHLRVNLRAISRADYLARLSAAGIGAHPLDVVPTGVIVEAPVSVGELPGFGDGLASVQDAAAQFAAIILDAQPGERVLDACAAPGGKAMHILEHSAPPPALIALDRDAQRLERVHENLARIRLPALVVQGDALQPASWWDGQPFDRMLIDAPCSATGVIRRHPDIKLLRTPQQMPGMLELQRDLLAASWPLLKPGGRLLYCTCSVLRRENSEQIEKFLATHKDARILPLQDVPGISAAPGHQLLPGQHGTDGFYYAYLQRT